MRRIREEVRQAPAAVTSEIDSNPEVSVVMPCLNEADTLEACITKAQRVLHEHGIQGAKWLVPVVFKYS